MLKKGAQLMFSSFSLVDRRWMENQPLPEAKILLRGGQGLPSRSSVGSRRLNKATAAFQEISGMLSCNATRLFLVTQQLAVEGLIIFLGEERQFVPLEPLETFLLSISRRKADHWLVVLARSFKARDTQGKATSRTVLEEILECVADMRQNPLCRRFFRFMLQASRSALAMFLTAVFPVQPVEVVVASTATFTKGSRTAFSRLVELLAAVLSANERLFSTITFSSYPGRRKEGICASSSSLFFSI